MPIYGKSDGQWYLPGLVDQRPEQQIPVMKTLFAPNTEPKAGSEKGEEPLKIQWYGEVRCPDIYQ